MIEDQQGQEKLLFEWIPSQKDLMLDLCERLANISSASDDLEGLKAVHTQLFKSCQRFGGRRLSVELPSSFTFDDSYRFKERLHPPAIVIEQRSDAPFRILLGGHFDTALPTNTPCYRQANRLFGSGVCDMKGGIVVLLTALQAFEKSSFSHLIGWDLLLTGDEEIGSPSSNSLWRQYAWRNRLCLLFEPSLQPGLIVAERMASVNLLLRCKGCRAHAGRHPKEGASAITALMHLLQLITEMLHNLDETLVFNVGKIAGGEAANVIAAEAFALINMRANNDETLRLAQEAIDRCCHRVKQQDPRLDAIQKRLTLRPHKPWRQIDQDLFNVLQRCGEKLSMQVNSQPSGGVCDGNLVAAEGIPTLDTLGVDGGAIHTTEEWLDIDSLVPKAQLTAAFLFALAKEAATQM